MPSNKSTALALFSGICETPIPISALAPTFAAEFTSHHLGHPVYKGTGEAWLKFFQSLVEEGKLKITVKKAIEEGDQVWLWYVMEGFGETKEGVEMFTFDSEGKFLEKYDVQQTGVQE